MVRRGVSSPAILTSPATLNTVNAMQIVVFDFI